MATQYTFNLVSSKHCTIFFRFFAFPTLIVYSISYRRALNIWR